MSTNPTHANENTLMMKEWGDFLGTRALGERVRESILAAIRGSSGPVIVDFSEVRGITQSFADEAFRKLIAEVGPDGVSRILIRGGSDDVRAVLRYATSRRTLSGNTQDPLESESTPIP